jgi:hypothetical protein
MARHHDVSLTDLRFDLRRSKRPDIPLEPLIASARARMTDAGLEKVVQGVLEAAAGQLPVEAELVSAAFTPAGAKVELKVGKGKMLSTVITVDVAARGDGRGGIIAELGQIRGLGFGLDGVLGPFIERVLDSAVRPGVRRDRRAQALVISPNEMLEAQQVPLAFDAKGKWTITPGNGWVEAAFATRRQRSDEEE